jgi:hypothetical protein
MTGCSSAAALMMLAGSRLPRLSITGYDGFWTITSTWWVPSTRIVCS